MFLVVMEGVFMRNFFLCFVGMFVSFCFVVVVEEWYDSIGLGVLVEYCF